VIVGHPRVIGSEEVFFKRATLPSATGLLLYLTFGFPHTLIAFFGEHHPIFKGFGILNIRRTPVSI
jgi:hypothetical protein